MLLALCCVTKGWAIRGWNNQEGASRLKALFDVVPKGQWIVSDMDVDGIWRYFGNYSFFGAPFIWTTLHGAMYCFLRVVNVPGSQDVLFST